MAVSDRIHDHLLERHGRDDLAGRRISKTQGQRIHAQLHDLEPCDHRHPTFGSTAERLEVIENGHAA